MCKGMTSPPEMSVLEQWRQPYRDGVLTREEMEQYWNEGYLVKHDLIPAELLEAVKQAISRSASIASTSNCSHAYQPGSAKGRPAHTQPC